MILADRDILESITSGELTIIPADQSLIRPASICLRLGSAVLVPRPRKNNKEIDVRDGKTYPDYARKNIGDDGFLLIPKQIVLAATLEKISIPRSISAWISGLSGLARLGIEVVLSNLVSPGYGEKSPCSLTLEIINHSVQPIRLYRGMRICHIVFFRMSNIASAGYDVLVGTYSDQDDPKESRFFEDFGNAESS
jgi:dCTP deaminase